MLAVARPFHRYLALVLHAESLDAEERVRDGSSASLALEQRFSFASWGFGAALRAGLLEGIVRPYAQAGPVAALVRTRMVTTAGARSTDERHEQVGPGLHLAAGLAVMPAPFVGFLMQVSYLRAHALRNLLGDEHDVGGTLVTFGMRGAL